MNRIKPLKPITVQKIDLNLIDYIEAFEIQKKIVSDMINGNIEHDTILILEHHPVFTLGKRGGRDNLIVSEEFLKSRDIAIIQTERGGNITYHGPGQVVIYPIVNIEKRRLGVSDFVCSLEKTMIRTASDFGVTAVTDSKNNGVWVKSYSKLGSVGLSIKRGISFHGLALNVNLDLTPFSWINPCGMANVAMTSLENEIKQHIEIKRVKEKLLYHFKEITGI
ncbi:MAG: lipoyl(octanoyl) transferase LipB [Desulfamplus sp.]|nr:lipoyl(octanoyl) transferase LipB [Desulfamplus sp.]